MTRAELYALVWHTPMLRLAKRFGLSDVGLRKICKKHDVPTPPLGYWAKLAHGKKVRQPALPPLAANVSDQIDLTEYTSQPLPAVVSAARKAATEAESEPDRRIHVPTELPSKLHPVASEIGKALRKERPDNAGMVTFIRSYRPVIYVGLASITRVEILLHTLASALTQRGNTLTRDEKSIQILLEDVPFEVRIYETKIKSAHVPTKEELARKAQYEADHRRYPTIYPADRRAWPIYDYGPSGKLALEVTDPSRYSWNNENLIGRWYDRKNATLGDAFGEVMIALATGTAAIKLRRAEELEAARRAAEEEERRKQEQARRERAAKRRKFLTALADDYTAFRKLADFAPVILETAVQSGGAPIDRMGRVYREMLAEMSRRFDRDNLNAEIERLALFGDGDPA